MRKVLFLFLFCCLAFPLSGFSEPEAEAHVSPKKPWRDFEVIEEVEPHPLRTTLLWIPNRLLDLIDVFKVDVGGGPAVGGVVRISKYAQAGYREMSPMSVRVGALGRRAPVLVERANEMGIGPAFASSPDRIICPGEIGVGLDLFIVGGYAGVCVDEAVDFLGGLFLFDVKDDDLK